ncbi:MAG: hypothetical protein WBY94_07205 [Polyangiaceae bacterium]
MSRASTRGVRTRNDAAQQLWRAKFMLTDGKRGRCMRIQANEDPPNALKGIAGAKAYCRGLHAGERAETSEVVSP